MKIHRAGLTSVQTPLAKFMTRVYTRTGLGIASTLGTSLLLMPVCLESPMLFCAAGSVVALGGAIGIGASKPTYTTAANGDRVCESNPIREGSFWALTTGMGVALSPLVSFVSEIDPLVLPASVGVTGAIFGGCALFARSRLATDKLLDAKIPLLFGLGSLVLTQLVGLGSSLLLGPNSLSDVLHNVDVLGGIGLMTLFCVYDTYVAKTMFNKGKPDHIGCSVSLYLDTINILVRMMDLIVQVWAESNKTSK